MNTPNLARRGFDESGSIADAIPHRSTVRRYPCAAAQCTIPGTLFPSGASDGPGLCAYHYEANPGDWPRVTQTILEWACVTDEINASRRAHTNPITASDPGQLAVLYANAAARVHAYAPHWDHDLQPQNDKTGSRETYRAWTLRLERFMGQRVVESMRKTKRAA